MHVKRNALITLAAFAALACSGCETLSFYGQSVAGQWEILSNRRPISEVIADAATDDALREKLQQVSRIREFATDKLLLPDNDSYRSVTLLQREFVVWSTFATPEFSTEPRTWCFPVVGCVGYRGYFSEQRARRFAARLTARGDDVFVGGVAAYSTLGWFADPVLDTMLGWEETRLANVIFHELAHQQLYVKDDTEFNESFATAVGEIGAQAWLTQRQLHGQLVRFRQEGRYARDFVDLALRTRAALEQVYGSDLDVAAMRAAKRAAFQRMRERYHCLKNGWDGYDGYDDWMSGELNNARLAALHSYHRFAPAFLRLFADQRGDLAGFYREVARIGALPREQRHALLESLNEPPAGASSC